MLTQQYADYCKGESFLLEQACLPEQQKSGKICPVPKAIPYYCASKSKACYDPPGKKPASCVTDLCPTLAGVQPTFPFASVAGGPLNTCTDACPDVADQDVPIYDLDGDGIAESCSFDSTPKDKCPENVLKGFQPVFPFDTNGDKIGDSCVAPNSDLCPLTTEVDSAYPFDTNGDGIPDSCEAPALDLCPQTLAIDSSYLFDTNGDGVKDSCFEVSNTFCTDPDPTAKYPGDSLYVYEGNYHLGKCIEGQPNKIKHFICQDNGAFIIDITECGSPFVCQYGACQTCADPDGTKNFAKVTTVTYTDAAGATQTKPDVCLPDQARDYFCNADNSLGSALEFCNEGKWNVQSTAPDGTTLCTCQPYDPATLSCSDPDGTKNFAKVTTVTYTDAAGTTQMKPDVCLPDQARDYFCNADNSVGNALEFCNDGKEYVQSTSPDGATLCTCLPLCKETDKENKPDEPGQVTAGAGVPHPDWCEGTILHQFACDATNTKVDVPPYDCATEGKKCTGGKCTN